MISGEVAQILTENWLKEWLKTLDEPRSNMAWNPDKVSAELMVGRFLQWLKENK